MYWYSHGDQGRSVHILIPARGRDINDYLKKIQHAESEPSVMSSTDSQACSELLTVISENIEGLSVNKISILSELCKREHATIGVFRKHMDTQTTQGPRLMV